MAHRSQFVVMAGVVLAAAAWVSVAGAQDTLASSGVYTSAQADRGMSIYDGQCASCHELSRFKGKDFASAWTDKPLTDLHTAVKSMPMDNPGSLKPEEYADILAYFLSINGYPAGQAELKGDDAAIAAIKVDVKTP
jgi:mono/diheme cytochrome c family protein